GPPENSAALAVGCARAETSSSSTADRCLWVQRSTSCATSIQGRTCDRTHLNLLVQRMADPLCLPHLEAPSTTLTRWGWPWSCCRSQTKLSSNDPWVSSLRKHGGASSRLKLKSLRLSGSSSRRLPGKRCPR